VAEAVEEQPHQTIGGGGPLLVGRHANAPDGAEQVGSIDVGKDADLVIYNHDPLSAYAVVQETLIDGRVYFDRKRDISERDAREKEKVLMEKEKKAEEKKSGDKKPGEGKPVAGKPEDKPKPPQSNAVSRGAL